MYSGVDFQNEHFPLSIELLSWNSFIIEKENKWVVFKQIELGLILLKWIIILVNLRFFWVFRY